MTEPTLLEELRAARAALLSTLQGLRPGQRYNEEGWTVHDLLGMSAAWDREVLATMQAWQEQGARYMPEGWSGDPAAWAARARARRSQLYPEQVRMDFFMARRELEDLLDGPYAEGQLLESGWEVGWHPAPTPAALVRAICLANDLENRATLRMLAGGDAQEGEP